MVEKVEMVVLDKVQIHLMEHVWVIIVEKVLKKVLLAMLMVVVDLVVLGAMVEVKEGMEEED